MPQARTPLASEIADSDELLSRLCSRGDGWRHSCSCHETSTSIRGFVQTRFVIQDGSIPPPRSGSALAPEAGLLRGRLRSVASDASSPDFERTRGREVTWIRRPPKTVSLPIRALSVVMSSLLLELALRPRDLLRVLSQESPQSVSPCSYTIPSSSAFVKAIPAYQAGSSI